ncbi:MAG TPA: ankyrin repeat domain-containing protein [Allosphingosinicella sp.]|nr:ankyrin repeat domain-containing protein [Allosphingosinicella sp.]
MAKTPVLRRLALACLASALAQPAFAQPSPEQAAAAAIAAGDARPIRGAGTHAEGITCFLAPVDDAPPGRGALAFREAVPRRASFEAQRDYAARYNRAVLASAVFPYPDVCSDVPAERGIDAQRAALRPPRDDGSLVGAIRTDRIDLVRVRLAADPGAALRPDPDFGNSPMAWAAARGRLDMIEALVAAGADPLQRDETMVSVPYMNALMWGRREAALWLIARAPRWTRLRHGEDLVRATVYALGPEVAFRLVDRFAREDPAALPELAWQAINWNSPRPPAFWLGFLADRRWPAGCAAAPLTCEQLAMELARIGDDAEVRSFFGQGWRPPPATMSRVIAGTARATQNAERVILLGAFPYDRAVLAGLPLVQPRQPDLPFPPDMDPERRRRAEAARAVHHRNRAATLAALRRLGVPAGRLLD